MEAAFSEVTQCVMHSSIGCLSEERTEAEWLGLWTDLGLKELAGMMRHS